MKKLVITSMLLCSTFGLLADEIYQDEFGNTNDWFIGVDYPIVSNMNMKLKGAGDSIDSDYEYKPLVFKIGAGTQGGLNMDVYFSTAKPDFDKGGEDDNAINKFGYDIRYELDTGNKGFYPYIQGGVSYGWRNLKDTYEVKWDEDTHRFVGLKAGAGVSYYINKSFQILAGVDFEYLNWQDIKFYDAYGSSVTIETTSQGNQIYIGGNFWF